MEQHDRTKDEARQAPPAPEPGASDGALDAPHVMDIIADVEKKLDQMRSAQKANDQELASLAERGRRLAEQEQALDEQRRVLEDAARQSEQRCRELEAEWTSKCEQVGKEQQSLAKLRESIEQERAEASAERDEVRHQRVLVEESEQKLQEQQAALEETREHHEAEMQRRREEVASDQKALQEELERVGRLEKEMVEERQRFARAESELQREREALQERLTAAEQQAEAARRQAEELRGQVEEADARASELGRQIDAARSDLAASSGALEDARGELERTKAERQALQERVETLTTELEQVRQAGDLARQEVATLTEQVESLRASLEATQQRHDAAQRDLAVAGEKLAKFADALGDQAHQLERGAVAIATVQEQEAQIERLNKQIASLKMAGDPAETERKDQRIAELTEALRQARGQSTPGDDDVAALHERVASAEEERDVLRRAAEQARLEIDQLREQIAAQEQARADGAQAPEDLAEREETIRQLTEQVKALQAELDEKEQALDELADEEKRNVSILNQRIAELQKRIVEADAGEGSGDAGDLEEKRKRLQEFARHMRRRRERLRRLRQMIRVAPRGQISTDETMEARAKQIRELQSQRQDLMDLKRVLAASEAKMVRRWARPRAVATFGWIMLMTILVATASWFATDAFFPAIRAASVTLQAKSRDGRPLSDEALAEWQAWHAEVLEDGAFVQAVADRMAGVRLDAYASVGAVEALFEEHLTVTSDHPERFTLTLAGDDGDEACAVLDMVAVELAQESRRQMTKRGMEARAVVLGERQQGGRVFYSSLNAAPIEDERFVYFGPVFGGAMLVTTMLVMLVYARLARARRVFEEDQALLADTTPVGQIGVQATYAINE